VGFLLLALCFGTYGFLLGTYGFFTFIKLFSGFNGGFAMFFGFGFGIGAGLLSLN
jgi:hypothetical protein